MDKKSNKDRNQKALPNSDEQSRIGYYRNLLSCGQVSYALLQATAQNFPPHP
jgi:hypothetical protein